MPQDEPSLVLETAPRPAARTRPAVAPHHSFVPKTSDDLARILAAPREMLGDWPTPISDSSYHGQKLLIKRDDLSGFSRGGAKTRKIEHVLGLMHARRHDELITVVGNITNLGFDLLPALRAHGFSWRIFVQDDPPLPERIRQECFRGIGSDLQFLGRSRLGSLAMVSATWVGRRLTGKNPFLLLPGGSHPAGVIGNACGFIEMAHQLRNSGQPLPKRVYVSAATGTTIAGFLLAENALRRAGFAPVDIIGVQVYPGNIVARTRWLLRWTERHLRLENAVDPGRVAIRTEALSGGFGAANPELEEVCVRAARETNVTIDPIFGGKTWSVMERDFAADHATERPVMFWHCGHTPEWKPLVDSVRATLHRERHVPRAASGHSGWRGGGQKLGIIAIYVAAFYGGLPWFLRAFGVRLDAVLGLPPMAGTAVHVAGASVLIIGAIIVLSSIVAFLRIGCGLPISHLPPKRLVNLNVYRWTRHPHYVGYNLAIVGWGLLAGSWGHAIGEDSLLLGLWLIYILVSEEPRLVRRFGDNYVNYRRCVRVLPGPSPYRYFQDIVARFQSPLERLANHLVLARTGPVIWVTYGLFGALGAAAMGLAIAWFLLEHGRPAVEAWLNVALIATMITLSSRIAWFVIPGDKPQGTIREMLRRVGFVSWGGYAAAFTTAIWLGQRAGISALRMLDIVMLGGLFAAAISRWGCFAYGCCIGQPAEWGVRWTHPDAWIHRLRPGICTPRVPTQLLSSLHAAIGALAVLALSFVPSAPGALAAIGGLLYTLPRFGVEHLREEARVGAGRLTTGQIASAVVFVLSIALLFSVPGVPGAFWQGRSVAGAAWALVAAAGSAFAIVFIAYGAHWKQIGRW